MSEPFAEIFFKYRSAVDDFEEELADLGVSFSRLGCDDYDTSLEIYEAQNDCRLSDECQIFIYKSGFIKVYVNHRDGWETHYTWTDGTPVRGWRRLRREGGFDISFWPEQWTKTEWLENGYMRIVPDPLEVPTHD